MRMFSSKKHAFHILTLQIIRRRVWKKYQRHYAAVWWSKRQDQHVFRIRRQLHQSLDVSLKYISWHAGDLSLQFPSCEEKRQIVNNFIEVSWCILLWERIKPTEGGRSVKDLLRGSPSLGLPSPMSPVWPEVERRRAGEFALRQISEREDHEGCSRVTSSMSSLQRSVTVMTPPLLMLDMMLLTNNVMSVTNCVCQGARLHPQHDSSHRCYFEIEMRVWEMSSGKWYSINLCF